MSDRMWWSAYPEGLPRSITPEHETMLAVFDAAVSARPDATAISYFDAALTYRELDRRADALASHLADNGFRAGDRLALYTQNDPAFLIGLVAAWKAGGVAVLINPMNRGRELRYLLQDSGAVALLCLDDLYVTVAKDVLAGETTKVACTIVASAYDDQTRDDRRVLPGRIDRPDGVVLLSEVAAAQVSRAPRRGLSDPSAAAVLTYTSGTTGVPKGVVNTHGALAFNAQTYRDWMHLGPDTVVLGIAPLFHITGLVGHVCTSMLVAGNLVLAHRFEGSVILDAIREHRPTFTVGAITAFANIAALPTASREDFSSLRAVYSGGAPISPQLRDDIRERTGMEVHNIYGMTETTSPTHAVPLGLSAPVDSGTGALSIGVPVFDTTARIVGDDGETLAPGELGEIAISGPQVTPGYWNKPDETAQKLVNGELRTGDVGLMDENGWFFVVDRKSDMIIASGYKVWPREVEDVLQSHPAVREAAVIGIDDPYRGQTVKAFVSLLPGADANADALTRYCKEQLAAYKYPRLMEIVDELPKNAAGKILRRNLR